MRIALTGSHGTGKSTLCPLIGTYFGLSVYDNISSNIILENQGKPKGYTQELIVSKYLDIFKNEDDFISARGYNDIIAYTQYLDIDQELRIELLDRIRWVKETHPITQIYIPIMFPLNVANNPARFTYGQHEIDEIIQNLGYDYKVQSTEVGERVNEIINFIYNRYGLVYNKESDYVGYV